MIAPPGLEYAGAAKLSTSGGLDEKDFGGPTNMNDIERAVCSIHGIPDCSPMLNGCSLVIRAVNAAPITRTTAMSGRCRLPGMDQHERDQIVYAFGHLVGSFGTDAHAADSGELAHDVLRKDLGFAAADIEMLEVVAEEVAGNWEYTGAATNLTRRIEAGEV